MNIPDDLRYSVEHEWVRVEGNRARVGITDYAQDALGDIVYVELPAVGTGCWSRAGPGGADRRRVKAASTGRQREIAPLPPLIEPPGFAARFIRRRRCRCRH